MPKNLVNLDALLLREDFEEVIDNPEPPPAKLPQYFRLPDIVSGITATALRKPDFQRETAYWSPRTAAEFVQSFVAGDVIPSIILWRSPTTGNIFVIDGAHRLSALIAWAGDDYGDRAASRAFFENIIPPEQDEAGTKTRNLIKKLVGSYESLQAAARHPENTDQAIVTRARNADLFEIPLLWVVGDAKKAEESFYRINSKAVAIDATELRIIKSRKNPSAIVARAIIKGGVGHEYWSAFSEDVRAEIKELAKLSHEILFIPPMPKSPLNTLDLPIAGRSYSGGESLGLIFDFVSLANNLVTTKQTGKGDATKPKETVDVDGQETITYLKSVKRIAQRLSGKHPSSLGLHPAVYFYGITGRYQPTAFLATIGLIQHLESKNGFNWFTQHRAAFEEFLLRYRYFTNQIVSQFGGRLKSYDALLSFFKVVLTKIGEGKSALEIAKYLQEQNEFRYLKERDEQMTMRAEISTAVKTVTYVREAIETAIRCKICHARISPRSISYDHVQRRADGGLGDARNAQMTHPYCNTTYKETDGTPIAMPVVFKRAISVKA